MDGAEHLATASAWNLDSAHSGALLRLERLLRGRHGFTLVVLEYSDSVYRDRVIRSMERTWEGGARVDAREVDGDFAALEDRLAEASREHAPVQVVGIADWPPGLANLWQALNYHREQIAERCPAPLLFWVLRGKVGDLALEAPDFWAWRSGVFEFGNRPPPDQPASLESLLDRGRAPAADRSQRIEEINVYLAKRGKPSHSADLRLLVERGELLQDLGELAGALESFQAAAAGYESGDDRHGEALAKRWVADILATQGDPAQALRLLREEALPVYEKLGDVRECASTMGQIADILFFRGDLDEALRIRREEELPVYEKLGDVRSRAIAMGKIADILFSRGDLAEALRIRREEELPVYEKLGDVRERAITMSQIASILEMQGHLDEALRIRTEESLPVYEKLGDVRSRAITMGKIADILESRGDLDEALRIRREEELPVFEKLGNVRERAITMAKVGLLLFRRGQRDEARGLFSAALRDAEGLKIPEAEAIRRDLEKLAPGWQGEATPPVDRSE